MSPPPRCAGAGSLLAGPTAKAAAIAGSEMAAAISAFDWAATPLGPAEHWPQGLKAAVRLMLGSRYPMFIAWGPELIFLYNDAYAEVLGPRHPGALGRPARHTWAEIWDAVGPQFEAVLREGVATWNDSMRLVMQRRGYAEETFFTFSYSPCFDDQGEVGGVFCTCTDDTARVLAEKALRDSEARLREMAEAMPQIVFVAAADGRLDYVNGQWEAITGQAGAQPEDLPSVVHPDDLPELQRRWAAALRDPLPLAAEYRLRNRDGSWRWFLTRAVPALDDRGRVVRWYGTSTDIDASHRNAEALAQAHAALQQVERRKDQFIATLAHELRNPLAPLRNGVQLLALGGGPDGGARVQAMMRRQIDHLVRLVDDLLEVSRITSGKVVLQRQHVALDEVLVTAAESSRPVIEAARHSLHVDVDGIGGHLVDGDAMRLGQVFTNLLNNAAKYTEPGGHIALSARREGPELVAQVQDNGMGLDADMLEEVFQPFVQVDRSAARAQGGLGIGLSIVRSLVELHGGKVRARSLGRDRGSVFEVRLPLAQAAVPQGPEPRTAGVPGPAPGVPVLVVDDNRDAADSLGAMLDMMGARARVVYGGPDALSAVEQEPPTLVLLDLGMPGMDGYEVIRRLAQHPARARMHVVALTGWGQAEDRQRTREAGFDDHLVKPAEIDALEALLARCGAAVPA